MISDIYVMAIYHFYKGGKKTVYFKLLLLGCKAQLLLGRKAQLTPLAQSTAYAQLLLGRKGIRVLSHRPLIVQGSLLVHARR